ncbi:MAG: phenylalanine--tRNA ligase subunit beta [Patescibacteria group bacterium]|jgi:phenylalanyl-tRNA synthetase beta chain|nr:phenylalanine--tRNA ligase subunit beta [Patescibacteria group bacterium]
MYLSLNCLKDFVKIPAKIEAEHIAELLTMHTVEVESWRRQQDDFNKVVVAKVLSVAPHPNADRLRLAKVDYKKEVLDIVCGASNLQAGQKVALALIGAKLPNGLEIKESEIRGEKSFGMICAEDELGLGDDHEGILVLSDKAKVGQPLAEYLSLNDIIFEIDNKSLSNRGDLWGHYGMARELSVLLKSPLKEAINISEELIKPKVNEKLNVKVEDKKICSRYIAVKINNVKAIESPAWLKDRLSALGVKPINALVDITNYVMLELGQPLHVFDATNIKKIIVHQTKEEASLETLDEKERVLNPGTIVISNQEEIIAIAGIMGGLNSAIKEDTSSIILEAATFDAVSIRRSSQALNLRTDASMRFEKTLDPFLPQLAWQRAWQLIKEIMPEAELASAINDSFLDVPKEKEIEFNFSWLKKSLGYDISRKDVLYILEHLGFQVVAEKNLFKVKVPSWRAIKDVNIPEDILEEIARVLGYNQVPVLLPTASLQMPIVNTEREFEYKIKDVLSGAGAMNEVYNYSFVGESALTKLNLSSDHYLSLLNPMNNNHELLRQNLFVGLMSNVRLNQFNFDNFAIFEIGRVFLNSPGIFLKNDSKNDDHLPYQGKRLGMLVAGDKADEVLIKLKSLIKLLLNALLPKGLIEFVALENNPSWSEKNRAAQIVCLGKNIGVVGQYNKQAASVFGVKTKVAIAEINLPDLMSLWQKNTNLNYEASPKYPAVSRDVAFVVDEKIMYNDFWKELINFHPLLIAADLFDIYQGENLGVNKKSWAFHLTYQDNSQTLTSTLVDNIQAQLVTHLQEKFEAQIRIS